MTQYSLKFFLGPVDILRLIIYGKMIFTKTTARKRALKSIIDQSTHSVVSNS